jgi:hypothetical protein
MICDILLIEDDNFVISGEDAIVDFKNVTKSHLLQLDPLLVKKLAVSCVDGSVNESIRCLFVFGSFRLL